MSAESLPDFVRQDSEPWERLRGESGKAFQAFQLYAAMGAERSLAKVGVTLGKHRTQIERWSGLWAWVARVEVFDLYLDRVASEKLRRGGLDLAALRQETSKTFLDKARSSMERLDRDLSPSEAARLAEVAARAVPAVGGDNPGEGFESIVVGVQVRRTTSD